MNLHLILAEHLVGVILVDTQIVLLGDVVSDLRQHIGIKLVVEPDCILLLMSDGGTGELLVGSFAALHELEQCFLDGRLLQCTSGCGCR